MSVNFIGKGTFPFPVEKVVQARLEKLHKEKESYLSMENASTGKDGELDYSKRLITFTNSIAAIFRKRLDLNDDLISTQEEVWAEKSGRVTWIRTSWLSFSDKFSYVEMELYEPHKKNPEMTEYERTAAAEVSTTGLTGQATKFLLKALMKQAFHRDTKLMNSILS